MRLSARHSNQNFLIYTIFLFAFICTTCHYFPFAVPQKIEFIIRHKKSFLSKDQHFSRRNTKLHHISYKKNKFILSESSKRISEIT